MSFQPLIIALKGGAGSGHFGHAGIPGKVGGSAVSNIAIPAGLVPNLPAGQYMAVYSTTFNKQTAIQRAAKLGAGHVVVRINGQYHVINTGDPSQVAGQPIYYATATGAKIAAGVTAYWQQQGGDLHKATSVGLKPPTEITPDTATEIKRYQGDLKEDFIDYGVSMFSNDDRSKMKDKIITNLVKDTGLEYEAVNRAIGQWAGTSNDTDYRSLSMQEAAARVFGSELSGWQKDQLAEVKNYDPTSNKAKHIFENNHAPYKTPDAAADAFVKAMYKQTQDEFRKAGVKSITLYRGASNDFPSGIYVGNVLSVKSNALESWTTQKPIARVFGHNIIKANVPVERIVGNATTGFGCLNEWEYVVIGGKPNDYAQVDEKLYE